MSKARTLASTVSTGAVLADGTLSAAEVTGAQPTLVSGTSIKTVNSTSLLGSGDVAVQPTLASGTNIKTVNSTSLLGSGDVAVQPTLVSGTNIKTVSGQSVLGSGDIAISAGFTLGTPVAASGTVIEFTGIPDGVKQVIVTFIGVGIGSPADSIVIRLGTAVPTFPFDYLTHAIGLLNDISLTAYTSGFLLWAEAVNAKTNGQYIFNLQDSTNNHWVGTGISTTEATRASLSSGRLFLPSRLGAVQIRTRNGSPFVSGTVNIAYI